MLEKINEHYSFTAPATIYNEEALTTLELAARTAAKVNECVQAFNDMDESVKNEVKTQHNLLNEIDLLVQKFLPQSYPDMTESGAWPLIMEAMRRIVDEGKFAEIYDVYADYVRELVNVERTRIDALIGGVTPASDVELTDLRIDCEGRSWGSAGTAVRNMTRNLLDRLSYFTKPRTIDVFPEWTEECCYNTNAVMDGEIGKSATYRVSAGEMYLVSSYYGFSIPDVVFKMEYRDSITGIGHTSAGTMTHNRFDKVVTVPEGTDYMIVNWADPEGDVSLIKAKKVEGYRIVFGELEEFISTAFEPLESLKPAYALCEKDNMIPTDGYIIRLHENGSISPAVVADGSTAYKVKSHIVRAGQRVKFSCSANFGNLFYYMYNEATGEVYDYEQSATGSTRQTLEKEFVVPIGVTRICVANISNSPDCFYMAGVKGASPFAGLKAYVIGDSVSEFNDTAEMNYLNYLSEKTGIQVENYANSGAGFLNEKENNTHYFGQVLTLPATVPDIVIVMGSGNDIKYVVNNTGAPSDTGLDTLYGQMYQVWNMLMSKYAGAAKIVFIAPPAWYRYTPDIDNNVMHRYTETMRDFCSRRCIPFLDLYHGGFLNAGSNVHRSKYFANGDGVHPNDAGHKIIASPIYNFLLGVIGMEGG